MKRLLLVIIVVLMAVLVRSLAVSASALDVTSISPQSGAMVGSQITINGSGLSASTAVSFESDDIQQPPDNWAAFTVVSDSQLTVTVPDLGINSGDYTIIVSGTGGLSAFDPFHYQAFPAGTQEILNITYLVTDDEDSGNVGYWALDNYTKTLQVWQLPDGTYFGRGGYSGQWQTFAGTLSPGKGVIEPQDGNGALEGGWASPFTFSGTFNPSSKPVSGNIGTLDYGGTKNDILKGSYGNGQTGNINTVDVLAQYFPGYGGFSEPVWGWSYSYGSQNWNNCSFGTTGDIIVNPDITASASSGGSITPSGAVSVNIGSSPSFSISANAGYHVANVVVDGVSVGPVYGYEFSNVSADHTISAAFAANATIPSWDVNDEHVCNYLDLTVLGLHFGDTGAPGWITADINKDGIVDYLDLTQLGMHWGQTWSLGDYVNYYTINDGTDPFTRSSTPMNLTSGNFVCSQSVTANGMVQLNIANAPGYADCGFYIYAGQLKNLNSIIVQAAASSSQFGLNLYFDKDDNGEFFNWQGNALNNLGNDAYILGPSSQNGMLNVGVNSQFTSLNPGGGNYTLAQLKSGAASGINGNTPVAIWIGITAGSGGSLNSTISSITIQ